MYSMIEIQKKVIEWGNSAGVYVPRKYLGKAVNIQILEQPRLSDRYIYGITISMECYGYKLLKPESFVPELHSERELKAYNPCNYEGEEIKIMLPEDIILELITKNPDSRLIKGIPVMLDNYKKKIDFDYMAGKANKKEFLGYLLEITLRIFEKKNLRKDLQEKIKMAIYKIKVGKGRIKFLTKELEDIYHKTKNPEAIESTKRDSLMRKWNIAYIAKEKEFEEVFDLFITKGI